MTPDVEDNPTVARRELAVYFSRLRQQGGLSLGELADELDVSLPQASRLDTGARTLQAKDVRKLADVYRLSKAERSRMLDLAEEARRRAWWQQVTLPDSYRTYIGMEQRALAIKEYCSKYMPGLLQLPEYMEAAAQADELPEDLREIGMTTRARRQQILNRPSPPGLWVILDEVVLARGPVVGDVQQRQVDHLYLAAQRREVTVQVIPFAYGLYPGPLGHLFLLDMPAPLPDVAYFEDWVRFEDSSDDEFVRSTRTQWESLARVAKSVPESLDLIKSYLR